MTHNIQQLREEFKGKVARLKEIHMDIYADSLSPVEKEVAEEGARWSASDDRYARTILQRGPRCFTVCSWVQTLHLSPNGIR